MEVGSLRWISVVARLFGVPSNDVQISRSALHVQDQVFPIEGGVVLLDETQVEGKTPRGSSEDVRRSFSEEWLAYGSLLSEHDEEFAAYFDLVELLDLEHKMVIDLGCGSGRWSAKLAPHVGAIVLVDFSDAIFVAKDNLSGANNALFFRGDVTSLPFANDSVDFLFSLGVLHHLAQPCLPVARGLMRLGPRGLFYLYYALDNRPPYYRHLLSIVTSARQLLGRVESEQVRRRISRALAWGVYRPMVAMGATAQALHIKTPIPLYEFYRGKSIDRIEQDSYDRFFTSIEQRVSRDDVSAAFEPDYLVRFSGQEPYWHFVVDRR